MRQAARTGGFTLVEVLVGLALASGVIIGAWFMFLSGSRQSAVLDRKLRQVQSLLILLEHLTADVSQAVAVPPDGVDGNSAGGRSLRVYPFSEYRPDPRAVEQDPDALHGVLATPVLYDFDAGTGRVTRNGRPLPIDPFRELRFYPPGPSNPGVGVFVRTQPARPASLGGGAEDSSGRAETEFTFLVPMLGPAVEEAFPSWQENYFDMVPGVGEP